MPLSTTLKVNFFFFVTLFTVNISIAQWQSDVRLTNNAANSFMSANNENCVASSGDVVHVIWFDNRDGNSEIYYKRSTDAGKNWSSDLRLTYNAAASGFPTTAVSGSVVHVAWEDYRDGNNEIYYKRSSDGGLTWGPDTRLTNNWANSVNASLSVSDLFVHLVWRDERDGNREIYYKRSIDGGVTWGYDTRLTYNSYLSQFPSISVYNYDVHIVWEENRDGNNEIYYKGSQDGGVCWGPDTRLTNNWANSYSPDVSVFGSVVHVVWFDDRDGNAEIYYRHSTDEGASWCPDTRLTYNSAASRLSSISASSSSVHVFWQDYRDGNFEIYYKRSLNEGNNWGADTRITNNSSTSIFPFVSVSGTVLHIIWEEYRDGNPEVYYKRDSAGNPENININVAMIVEGFYNETNNSLNTTDIVKAYLRNISSPYAIADSSQAIIDSLTFTGSFSFNNTASGTYYIIIKHRNSIETWSRNKGESLVRGTFAAAFDFTNAITKAFGDNMKQVDALPLRFGIYSGDVNQDGLIDLADLSLIDNDVYNYVYGYVSTDIDGNNFIDVNDAAIADNNAFSYAGRIVP
ncbi:MAG: hypothetical protein ABI840_03060 [bacterium]